MVAYLESHDFLDVSFGAGKESYEDEEDWINGCDRAYGSMGMVMYHNMCYLMDSTEYPFELWRNIDRDFGVKKEVDNTWSESNTSSIFIPSNVSASILSDEFVQDAKIAECSTHSIRIGESLLEDTTSLVAPEVHEISDISSSHTTYP